MPAPPKIEVAAVRPQRGRGQAEEVELPPMMSSWPRLPKIDVVAAAALDVVVAVGGAVSTDGLRRTSAFGRVAGRADRERSIEPSPWIVSLPSWPKITSSPAPPAM